MILAGLGVYFAIQGFAQIQICSLLPLVLNHGRKKTFGSAQMICDYLHETVTENGIDQYIQFGSYVTSAEFSSNEGIWTVKVKQKDQKV